MPKNVEDLGKLIVAKDFKKLSKVQNFAKSGHTGERDCKVTKKSKETRKKPRERFWKKNNKSDQREWKNHRDRIKENDTKELDSKVTEREEKLHRDNDNKRQRERWKAKYVDET